MDVSKPDEPVQDLKADPFFSILSDHEYKELLDFYLNVNGPAGFCVVQSLADELMAFMNRENGDQEQKQNYDDNILNLDIADAFSFATKAFVDFINITVASKSSAELYTRITIANDLVT